MGANPKYWAVEINTWLPHSGQARMAWKAGSEYGLTARISSIKKMSPGAIAETEDSSTRLSALGSEFDFSEAWGRAFVSSSSFFLSGFVLHRSRIIITQKMHGFF